MNHPIRFSLLIPIALISSSFLFDVTEIPNLVSSKWISPVNDNCFDSLCFTSDDKVMYYSCKHNIYAELGYTIVNGTIEIEAYSKSIEDRDTKMILLDDNGVLRQPSSQQNTFPRTFVKVPDGSCN